MELRFLKGNWGFGKFKLQYSPFFDENRKKVWIDVPTLGLSEEVEKKGFSQETLHELDPINNEKKSEEGKVWCEHQLFVESLHCQHTFKFCPICGTPRTSTPSLRERLGEKLSAMSIIRGDASCGMTPTEKALLVADVAIDFLSKEKS